MVATDPAANPRIADIVGSQLMSFDAKQAAIAEETDQRRTVMVLMARVGEFSALQNDDDEPLFPSLRNRGVQQILMYFALADIRGTDPQAAVKMGRFISFLLYNDISTWG